MGEEEDRLTSDLLWLMLKNGVDHANQLDVDEPDLIMPEREEVH